MQIVSLAMLEQELAGILDVVVTTSEAVTITSDGVPVAVLVGHSEWEIIQGAQGEISSSVLDEEVAEGGQGRGTVSTYTEDEIFAMYGAPPRRS